MGPSISLTLRHSLSRRRSACRSLPLHPCPRCKAQPHTHQGEVQTSSQSDDHRWNRCIVQKQNNAERNPFSEAVSSLKVPMGKKAFVNKWINLNVHAYKLKYRAVKPDNSLTCTTATGILACMPQLIFSVCMGYKHSQQNPYSYEQKRRKKKKKASKTNTLLNYC